ncbi:MAG: 16S rRNA (adenine(1518)-N(6)/adenine(1519)-N(6))-dimethyltransferase RsmA [Candidatus Paceibacterota bacterium]
MKAKKSLGQHFLRSSSALEKIAGELSIKEGDKVVEIGPGHGELTEKLLAHKAQVIAIEKDEELAFELKRSFENEIESCRLKIIQGDIKEIDLEEIFLEKNISEYKLVGNIPYYITGFLLRTFLSRSLKPQRIVFLLQKEVAQRIALSEKESILSLSIKAYGTPKYKGVVKAGSFAPPPKVDSAILLIDDITDRFKDKTQEELFFRILKKGFSQKRKFLINNLSAEFGKKDVLRSFEKCMLPNDIRPEEVKLQSWLCLSENWHK